MQSDLGKSDSVESAPSSDGKAFAKMLDEQLRSTLTSMLAEKKGMPSAKMFSPKQGMI